MLSDVDEYFDTDDFASPALYTNPEGVSSEIPVIFNAPFHAAVVAGAEYMSSDPSAICRTKDVLTADTSCELMIDTVVYHVREVQPDGTGVTVLLLSRD